MIYRLFKNKKGIIIGRTPKKIKSDACFSFIGGTGLTAILKNENGNIVYRKIVEDKCIIPLSILKGEVSVVVADLNNSMSTRYECEGVVCETDGECVWIIPREMDLPVEITKLQEQIEDLKEQLAKACKEITLLKEAYQGYDVI